jgi:DNA helicase-4
MSALVDEEITLVPTGTEFRKTNVITARAAYLVKAKIRQPEELLLLAFTTDVAKEMSERIEVRCGGANRNPCISLCNYLKRRGGRPHLVQTVTDDKAFLSLITCPQSA